MPGRGSHKFQSRAQVKWAFATHQKFARKWAHRTGMHSSITRRLGHSPAYRRLPARKGLRRRA